MTPITKVKVTNRLVELVALVVLLAAAGFIYDTGKRIYRNSINASEWMTYENVQVPDFHVGENPMVYATRKVTRDLTGRYLVDVYRVNGGQVCTGSGEAQYTMKEDMNIEMPLSVYVNNPQCELPVGEYFLSLAIIVRDDEGEPPKTVRAVSNEFRVLP